MHFASYKAREHRNLLELSFYKIEPINTCIYNVSCGYYVNSRVVDTFDFPIITA